jgi:oxalyl-CoA decarboxylase
MILLSGSSSLEMTDLNQIDYQGLDQLNTAKPFAKAAYRIDSIENIPRGIARAVRTAISGRPGGVYLDIPTKVLHGVVSMDPNFEVVDLSNEVVATVQEKLDDAFHLLKSAKRPLIIIGKGAAYSRAEDELLKFVTHHNIPFLNMAMAKGVISDNHDLCVNAARALALGNSDLVMLIGARLNWLLANGMHPPFAKDYKLIQIDICGEEIDAYRKVDAALIGDIKTVISQLNNINETVPIQKDWLSKLKNQKQINEEKLQSKMTDKLPMDFNCAFRVIRDEMAKDPEIFYCTEGANTLDFGRVIIPMTKPRKRLDPGTWGTMGVGLGYAIAAATVSNDKVLAVEGDSAFGFSGMELETICRFNLKIVIIIFNNGGIYKGDAVNTYSNDPDPTRFESSIEYHKLIEIFGGVGYKAENCDELATCLKTALAQGKPALINCLIDPHAGTESGHLSKMN